MFSESDEISSSNEAHLLFEAKISALGLAIWRRSMRTPVRLMACVEAVPASVVGIFFNKIRRLRKELRPPPVTEQERASPIFSRAQRRASSLPPSGYNW